LPEQARISGDDVDDVVGVRDLVVQRVEEAIGFERPSKFFVCGEFFVC